MLIDDFKSGLDDFYTAKHNHDGDPYYIRLHISHDDLDGFGCSVVGRVAEIINDFRLSTRWHNNSNEIIYENTPCIGKAFPDEMVRILKKYIPKNFTHGNAIVKILITDIQCDPDVVYDEIEKAFSNGYFDRDDINLPYFEILMIDHHQWPDPDGKDGDFDKCFHGTPSEATLTYHEYLEKERKDFAAVRISTYVNNNASATKLLSDLLIEEGGALFNIDSSIEGSEQLVMNVSQFAWFVSRYDTGNWGNWYCMSEQDFVTVSPDIILNQMIHYAYACGISEVRELVYSLARIIYNSKDTTDPAKPIPDNFLDITLGITTGVTMSRNVDKEIARGYYEFAKREILDLTRKYIDFCGKIDMCIPFSNENGSMTIKLHNKNMLSTLRINLHDCIKYFDTAYVYVDDLDEYGDFPYSLFAKKYFEDRMNEVPFDRRYIMMRVSAKHKDGVTSDAAYQARFDLRSYDDVTDDLKVMCSDFAKEYGGGGHPRAAGFTIDGVITHDKLI